MSAQSDNLDMLIRSIKTKVPRRGMNARRLQMAKHQVLRRVTVIGCRVVNSGADKEAAYAEAEQAYLAAHGVLTPLTVILIRIVIDIIFYLMRTKDRTDLQSISMACEYSEEL